MLRLSTHRPVYRYHTSIGHTCAEFVQHVAIFLLSKRMVDLPYWLESLHEYIDNLTFAAWRACREGETSGK